MDLKGTPRFMIIDDDKLNNEMSRLYIELAFPDAKIIIYSDPLEALEYIEHDTCSKSTILFLDINMPTLSGWDVLDRLMNFSESIQSSYKIFMFTSSICLSDKQKATEYSLVAGFIEKPFTIKHVQDGFTFVFE